MSAWESKGVWPSWSEHKVFCVLLGLLLLGVLGLTSVVTWKTWLESRVVGFENHAAPSITVQATGEVSVIPNVAVLDLGVVVSGATANAAQDGNTQKMNAIIEAVKELGIAETDVKTSSYVVGPRYDYSSGTSAIVGYEASQMITVTVRNTDLASAVLGRAGDLGANVIGSLRFEVDDPTVDVAQARAEAIQRAREQAEAIAGAMDRKLGAVVSYSEYGGEETPLYYRGVAEDAVGAGPQLEVGENDVQITVTMTYALE